MHRALRPAAAAFFALATPLLAQGKPTIAQFLSPASPLELTSAKRADRVAWIAYERGMRNVYAAAAPAFAPVRLTSFLKDDGTDLTDVSLSDDGSLAVFVRGSAPNRAGWIANPSHDPNGAEQAIWAARTSGGTSWRVAEGSAPALSPDGRWLLFVKDGQIYRASSVRGATASARDTGGAPFIKSWGRQRSPAWSPDGSAIAFVSDRENHAFIAVYDVRARTIAYMAPGVDCDASPAWSPDSKRIAFVRRPGTPFGMQAQQGLGGLGNPMGPAYNAAMAAQQAQARTLGFGSGCASGAGSGGGGGAPNARPGDSARAKRPAGLYTSAFAGGSTLAVMIADVVTGQATELWHNAANEKLFTNIPNLRWEGGSLVFHLTNIPGDEWDRVYSINTAAASAAPVLLTTTDGLIEDASSIALSPDGKTLYYSTNAGDIERRHIWAVPTSGGTPARLSTGDGIETAPVPLASGKNLAVLYFGASQPASVRILPVSGGQARVVFPTLAKDFPKADHVAPQIVMTKAADGTDIHNQLFLPKDARAGERRPAIVFVHGGPIRQMLPGYHYMQFYHWAYAVNQWLASQGYVVLSINYRSGIGYGRSFRFAEKTAARGNSEYQDVVAGAQYLQSRADVDPKRVGIWGLSYGGLLTAEALARNSDIFVAGADMAGVHLYGPSLDTGNVAYTSSAASHIDTWKSPVFLVHGDDDRNVDFAQTVGLVQLLRAHDIHYELIVIPDDLHESMIHQRWIDTFGKMGDFLHRFVWNHEVATTGR
ncbi:MAG: prolyl oligopeptidase family serine peptidase [Gemmatimonadaceae bacterium]